MKNTLIFILTLMLCASCKFGEENQSVSIDTPQEVKQQEKKADDRADQSFIDGMTGKLFHNYLEIKMALANEDPDQVKAIAKNMAASFTEERSELKNYANSLADSNNIDQQRSLFAKLTKSIGSMFEDALNKGTIYQKFCPMAFNNEGAYWYADISNDKNPYFGDKMPDCGKVTKTISK